MSRPLGTDAKYQESVKTVKTMFDLKKWSNKHIKKAMETISSLMLDEKASAVVRKGCAEKVLAVHKMFYDEIDGVAVPTVDEKKIKAEKAKKDAEENGGVPELVSLKFDGVDYGEEPTGTY